jgi:hypothetical protein
MAKKKREEGSSATIQDFDECLISGLTKGARIVVLHNIVVYSRRRFLLFAPYSLAPCSRLAQETCALLLLHTEKKRK